MAAAGMTRAGGTEASARAASKLRPDRPSREPQPVEDSLHSNTTKSPLAAPRAAGGPQQRGPMNQRSKNDDDDDFGDTDVTGLLG